jgi:hypothetical protein
MTLYKCINCHEPWKVEDGESEDFISHGSCINCMIEGIRNLQKRKGHDECFGAATIICNKVCRYHDECCKHISNN